MADISRRGLLGGLGAGLVASWGLRLGAVGGAATFVELATGQASGGDSTFFVPLRMPPILTGDHVTLVAKPAAVQVLPGAPTKMWTFNGTFPGPIIRRPSGKPVKVTVLHRLPDSVGSLTIHHHGAHSASSEDGQPERNVIPPGGQRTYTYGLVEDGKPERAAFQWYHDHSHYRTTRNLWHGLSGMFIVDDSVDIALPLPKGAYDVPLMLTERNFDANNQLTEGFVLYSDSVTTPAPPGVGSGFAPNDDLAGTRFLVNGVERPYLDVAARRYRFRFLNTSPFRPYNLKLSTGAVMTQIATESGLMPKPVPRSEVLIGPGERAEVIIDFKGLHGRRLTLDSGPVSAPGLVPATTPPDSASFMEFRVTKQAKETSEVPAILRPLPTWVAQASKQPHRVWVFGVGVNAQARAAWTINGRAFDPARVDAKPELGATETWMLVNASPVQKSHYIHIHDVDWKVLSRNGSPPMPGEDALKETFRLDPGEVLVIAAKFSDHLGHYMLHCHMLQHEDHGMMTAFEVVPKGQGDAPTAAGLDSALAGSIGDASLRQLVKKVVAAAQGGRPAPASALPTPSAEVTASIRALLTDNSAYLCQPP